MARQRFIIVYMLSALLLLTAAVACRQTASPQKHGPEIQYEDTVLNLGIVSLTEVQHFRYKFKNVGDQGLLIWHVEPDCGGCTKVEFPTDTIYPGQSGEIKVAFDAHERYTDGLHEFYIHVHTNTDRQYQDLTFIADLIN